MTTPLKRALVKRPDESFQVEDIQQWHYAAIPHLPSAQAEHDGLVATLKNAGMLLCCIHVRLQALFEWWVRGMRTGRVCLCLLYVCDSCHCRS
jgi:arginine deiminase